MDEDGQIGRLDVAFKTNEWPPHWQGWTKTDTSSPSWTWKTQPPPVPANHCVAMGLHHVIPRDIIRQAWNAFISNKAWGVLETWAQLLRLEEQIENLQGPLGRNQKLGMGADWLRGPRTKPLEPGDSAILTIDDFQRHLAWSAWNLVEGPVHRNDDPGNGFDGFDKGRFPRFFTLAEIDAQFRLCAAEKNELSKQRQTLVARVLKNARPKLRGAQVIPFQEAWWQLAQKGVYNKDGTCPKGGDPRWRKVT
jgi:hypothetical protein